MKINWSINKFGKQKTLLAFEFAIVLSDCAKQLNIEMTKEIVIRAEDLISVELRNNTAEHFACNMNVYALAILEPKDAISEASSA